jgi:hypothetical protein
MLFNEGGKREQTVPHRAHFENWLEQLNRFSALQTGNQHTYFTAIRLGFYEVMNANDWINSSHEWKDSLHKVIYDCLGDGRDPDQWNVSRMAFGLLLRHVIAHTGDEQEWNVIPKANKRRTQIIEDPEGTLYHCKVRRRRIEIPSVCSLPQTPVRRGPDQVLDV